MRVRPSTTLHGIDWPSRRWPLNGGNPSIEDESPQSGSESKVPFRAQRREQAQQRTVRKAGTGRDAVENEATKGEAMPLGSSQPAEKGSCIWNAVLNGGAGSLADE